MAYYCCQEFILCSSTPLNMLFTKKMAEIPIFQFYFRIVPDVCIVNYLIGYEIMVLTINNE